MTRRMDATGRVLGLIMLLALIAPARAQPVSPADLRREIESLQQETQRLATLVSDLQSQLAQAEARAAAAEARAEALAQEAARLREALERAGAEGPDEVPSGAGPDTPSAPEVVRAPVPEDPMAAPASLLGALQRQYAADFPDAAGESSPAPLDLARRRALEQWCVAQARTVRGPVSWRIRLSGLETLPRGERSAVLAVFDPDTGLAIGEPLVVALPRAYQDRVIREIARAGGDAKAPLWTLTGTLIAAPKVNPDRPTPGVFNHPAFVGPFVEFGFELKWDDLGLSTATAGAGDAGQGS